jgi:hypothetical protein
MNQAMWSHVRDEWRELGFFYDSDHDGREWTVRGSRSGLKEFTRLLRAYAAHPGNEGQSEHEHYGPYMYLKVMTWHEFGLNRDGIRGSIADIGRLAEVIDTQVAGKQPGERIRINIDEGFTHNLEYALTLRVEPDDFDPASADGWSLKFLDFEGPQ